MTGDSVARDVRKKGAQHSNQEAQTAALLSAKHVCVCRVDLVKSQTWVWMDSHKGQFYSTTLDFGT